MQAKIIYVIFYHCVNRQALPPPSIPPPPGPAQAIPGISFAAGGSLIHQSNMHNQQFQQHNMSSNQSIGSPLYGNVQNIPGQVYLGAPAQYDPNIQINQMRQMAQGSQDSQIYRSPNGNNMNNSPFINGALNVISNDNSQARQAWNQPNGQIQNNGISHQQEDLNFWSDLEPRPPANEKNHSNGGRKPRPRHLIQSSKRHGPDLHTKRRKNRRNHSQPQGGKPRWK